MEISYTYLRSKEVVNVADGKRLGRVCDVVFRYPENVFIGIVVPGCKGFSLKKGDVFTDELIDSYLEIKRAELKEYDTTPHPIEFKMYYSL